MTSRDYTKEIDLSTGEKNIPLIVAIPLLAAIAAGVWFGISAVLSGGRPEKAPEKISIAPPRAGQTVANR
jgi:hypothetical protein